MPKRLGTDDDLPPRVEDWTTRPPSEVPPWRQGDRDRLERARSNSSDAVDPAPASAQASELVRLAELFRDGTITAREFVDAATRALVPPT